MIIVHGKPVSVNAMYGRGRQGQKFLTKAAQAWKTLIFAEAYNWRQKHGKPTETPIHVRISFCGVKGDLDNYLKCTLDGLKVGLGIDDKHFRPIEAIDGGNQFKGAVIEFWPASMDMAIDRGVAKILGQERHGCQPHPSSPLP